MRILILPDVHQKIHKVKTILNQNQYDKLISLGDWFDNFYDTPLQAKETAEYLKDVLLPDPRFVWLLGNHDLPYMYPEMFHELVCSGVTFMKLSAILEVFGEDFDRSKLQLAYIHNQSEGAPVILSHAGVHPSFLNEKFKQTCESVCAAVEGMTEQAMNSLEHECNDPLLAAGVARMGWAKYGGIVWQDWNREFAPLPHVSQIVGHTPLRGDPQIRSGVNYHDQQLASEIRPIKPVSKDGVVTYSIKREFNLNLDTNLNHYAIIDTDRQEITIHPYEQYD